MRRTSQSLGAPPPSSHPSQQPQAKQKATDIEQVKRRWIRQNRDLAKSNSGQSLRIRALEQEVARLQADNLSLRGALVAAKRNACAAEVAGVRRMRDEMRAKIAELSGLVNGIDSELEAEERARAWDDQLQRSVPPLPAEGVWRERQPLAELMRDVQMPTIAEDKMWPRRSLDADEIEVLPPSAHRSSGGSPDLGPPPVAHFDYEDPVKSVSPLAGRDTAEMAMDAAGDGEALPASMSMNLETRRRRKQDTRRTSLLPRSPGDAESEVAVPALRTGAKRKLADREPEKALRATKESDFTFTRKTGKDNVQEGAEGMDNVLSSTGLPAARKVLGNKSVNLSPRKAPLAISDQPEKPERPQPSRFTAARDNAASRRRRVSVVQGPTESAPEQDILATIEIPAPAPLPDDVAEAMSDAMSEQLSLPPVTPAPTDFFSPTPSEASARAESGVRGDTPPPPLGLSALRGTATEGTGGAGARPSRRARPAVNYAEPSLVAKMRRPDKKMVDAVSGLQDTRRAVSCGGDMAEDAVWKALPPTSSVEPGSPLVEKSRAAAVASNSAPGAHVTADSDLAPALAATTLADDAEHHAPMVQPAVVARRRRSSIQALPSALTVSSASHNSQSEADVTRLENADIYEFNESSPLPGRPRTTECSAAERKPLVSKRGDVKSGDGKRRTTLAPSVASSTVVGSHRRHSSMPTKEAESRVRATTGTATSAAASTSVSASPGAGREMGGTKSGRTVSGGTAAGEGGRRRSMMM